jgi:hypothetical protein
MRASLMVALLLLAVEVSPEEFLRLQALPTRELQARFHLPSDCQPVLSAMTDPSRLRRLIVYVGCRVAKTPVALPSVPVFMPGHAHD